MKKRLGASVWRHIYKNSVKRHLDFDVAIGFIFWRILFYSRLLLTRLPNYSDAIYESYRAGLNLRSPQRFSNAMPIHMNVYSHFAYNLRAHRADRDQRKSFFELCNLKVMALWYNQACIERFRFVVQLKQKMERSLKINSELCESTAVCGVRSSEPQEQKN